MERAEALEGPGLLRGAAVAYLRAWSFEPVLVDGKPVRVQCDLRVPFHLDGYPAPKAGTAPSKMVVEIVQNPLVGPATSGPTS